MHFIKGTTGDLIASINGGSAFGEMARCVFGFAKEASAIGDVLRVMSQGKNSCGREDLSLEFAIESKRVTVSTGEEVEVGTFVLGEESDVSASELLTPRRGPRPLSPHMQLVLNHVNRQEGPVTPMDVFRAMLARDNKAAGQMTVTTSAAANWTLHPKRFVDATVNSLPIAGVLPNLPQTADFTRVVWPQNTQKALLGQVQPDEMMQTFEKLFFG